MRGEYDPSVGRASIQAAESLWLDENTTGQRYYIVQFESPPTESAKALVVAAGAELLDYLPDCAYVARVNPTDLAAVRQVSNVRWAGLFQPAFKTSPKLDQYLQTADAVTLQLRVFPGEDVDALSRDAESLGALVSARSSSTGRDGGTLRLVVAGSRIPELAKLTGVASVELYESPRIN